MGNPGDSFCPSNGTEGEIFQEQYCNHCARDAGADKGNGCDILARAFYYEAWEKEYPTEWIYGSEGKPMCTAFTTEPIETPPPRPELTIEDFLPEE